MSLLPSLASIPLALLLFWGEPFTFEFAPQTDAQGEAYVVINAHQNASGITVTIEGDDGTKVVKNLSLKGGKSKKIKWKQKGKNVHYTMNIKGGDTDTDFEFETRKARAGGKPQIQPISSREDIVDRHKVKYKTSFVVTSYKFQAINTNGDVIKEIEKNDAEVEIGGVIELSWDSPDELFMLHIRAEDDVGRVAEYRTVPWSVEIPHTDINFDSGKWDIKPNEAPKIDDAFAAIAHELDGLEQAVAALGPDFKQKITASLYIVGYTDTVGNPADNQVLSMNRAREIAKYFKDKGIWCSIYFAGMGERGLLVETDDSVDEIRNRRALYLLMPDPQKPAGGGKIPSNWKQLTGPSPRTMQELPPLPDSYLEFKRKRRAEQEKKFGAGDGGDDGGTAGGGGDDEWGKPKGDSGGGGGGDSEPYVGPEPVEGDDAGSATGKGCAVTSQEPEGALGVAVLLGLMGLRRRRTV